MLSQFRTRRSPVLIATDIAARGLDIKDIKLGIIYFIVTLLGFGTAFYGKLFSKDQNLGQ